jgi:hypothetical protein
MWKGFGWDRTRELVKKEKGFVGRKVGRFNIDQILQLALKRAAQKCAFTDACVTCNATSDFFPAVRSTSVPNKLPTQTGDSAKRKAYRVSGTF